MRVQSLTFMVFVSPERKETGKNKQVNHEHGAQHLT